MNLYSFRGSLAVHGKVIKKRQDRDEHRHAKNGNDGGFENRLQGLCHAKAAQAGVQERGCGCGDIADGFDLAAHARPHRNAFLQHEVADK